MKILIIILIIASLLFVLGAGCGTQEEPQQSEEEALSDITNENIEEDLDTSDLDNLEKDLDTIDWK